MQINVIEGSSPQLFNAMLFPEAHVETQNWLQEQFYRDTSILTDVGKQFMGMATEFFNRVTDSNLMSRARSMMRDVRGLFHPNHIVRPATIADVQYAKPVLQRYIMAMPELRAIYHRQLCDGYSDSYTDYDPGVIGEKHYDYRRVMNGIVVETEEGGWEATMYPDELREGDRELEADEQFSILRGWDLVRHAIGLRIDPTDVFNGNLEL